MPYVSKISYRRDSLEYCGDANKNFVTFLFSDQATGIQFLKDVGLIHRKVQVLCNLTITQATHPQNQTGKKRVSSALWQRKATL
jgi:hypothetical protein